MNLWVLGNYICLASVLLLLIPGWYYLLSALKLENLQRFAYGNSIIQFFLDNERIDIKFALSQRAKEAIEYNVKAGDRKAEKIGKAFKWSFPAKGFFVVSLLVAMFNIYEATLTNPSTNGAIASHQSSNVVYSTKRSVTMVEKNQGNSNVPQQSQNQPRPQQSPSPNPDVQAPPNVLITEGYDPPKSKSVEQK